MSTMFIGSDDSPSSDDTKKHGGAIPDKPLSLDQDDLGLCINGVKLIRDCGLLNDDFDKKAEGLIKRLEMYTEKEEGDAE